MKYDFDRVIDRKGSNCAKWGAADTMFGKDVIPMWVADMDFPVARPITEALRQRTDHEVYGYTWPYPSVVEAVTDRMWRKYRWKVEPDWVVFTPGVVPALNAAVKAFTHPGDEVIIQQPVYHPFPAAITGNGCCVANNQLKLSNGRYEVDFDDLEARFRPNSGGMMPAPSRARMMILCSPHNPVGRVWSREELKKVGNIIINNDAVMVSDEIHCELLYKGFEHVPFASISPEFASYSITCMAPSKTFNLAGLGASSIIIPDKALRDRFTIARTGILPRPNIFGLVALEAAYRCGDEWLEQLLAYLQGNLDFLAKYFETKIPEIKVVRPGGTYLVWLDCRGLGLDPKGLRTLMREKAKVGLEDGIIFGESGAGFQRMNIACPRSTLAEALGRIELAVHGR